jgi:toxin ParE1/3/4
VAHQVIWTEQAINNLDDIAEYITLSNLPAAEKLVNTILKRVDRLEDHPNSGRKPPELKNLNYREIVVNPCRVFYKLESHQVFIVHVMRQERQLRKYVFET